MQMCNVIDGFRLHNSEKCRSPRRKSTFGVKNDVSGLHNLESVKIVRII